MTVRPRVLVALGASVLAAVVLVGAWLSGGGDDPTPTTTTSTTSTTVTVPVITIAPTPITVLPDWYRKASSRYEDRRPSTVPPERGR